VHYVLRVYENASIHIKHCSYRFLSKVGYVASAQHEAIDFDHKAYVHTLFENSSK